MGDRPRVASRARGTSNAGQAPPTTTTASASVAPNGVRRNLFQSQLTRRPTASSSNSNEKLRLDADVNVDVLSDTSEIVVRDKQGEFELGDPPSPVLEDEDDVPLDDRQENEKERQRLAEAVKHHQINHTAVREQPEELLEAVRASSRANVAALAGDNWMFEREDQLRG